MLGDADFFLGGGALWLGAGRQGTLGMLEAAGRLGPDPLRKSTMPGPASGHARYWLYVWGMEVGRGILPFPGLSRL